MLYRGSNTTIIENLFLLEGQCKYSISRQGTGVDGVCSRLCLVGCISTWLQAQLWNRLLCLPWCLTFAGNWRQEEDVSLLVLLDLSVALDTSDHGILLGHLSGMGLGDNVYGVSGLSWRGELRRCCCGGEGGLIFSTLAAGLWHQGSVSHAI